MVQIRTSCSLISLNWGTRLSLKPSQWPMQWLDLGWDPSHQSPMGGTGEGKGKQILSNNERWDEWTHKQVDGRINQWLRRACIQVVYLETFPRNWSEKLGRWNRKEEKPFQGHASKLVIIISHWSLIPQGSELSFLDIKQEALIYQLLTLID